MMKLLAIAAGGGIGSIARYTIAIAAEKLMPVNFPLGTLFANLTGCLLIGICWSYFDRVHISNEFRLFIFTGFLGGFTTFPPLPGKPSNFLRLENLSMASPTCWSAMSSASPWLPAGF